MQPKDKSSKYKEDYQRQSRQKIIALEKDKKRAQTHQAKAIHNIRPPCLPQNNTKNALNEQHSVSIKAPQVKQDICSSSEDPSQNSVFMMQSDKNNKSQDRRKPRGYVSSVDSNDNEDVMINSISLPKTPQILINNSSNLEQSTVPRMVNSSDMTIVVLDDQLVNLEATKLHLIEFGFKGQIKLFISSLAAINFIMTYTIENKG